MNGMGPMDEILGAVNWTDVAIVAGVIIAVCLAVLYFAVQTQHDRDSRHQIGGNLKRERAVVTEWAGTEGYIHIGGELWRAASQDALSPGDKVTVVHADGLMLEVRKV